MRALGVDLPGLSSKTCERRPYPPGQHGQGRRKLTEYGLRLMEKQKLGKNYGVTERQLRRLMQQARAGKGPTGARLLSLLEQRLDNVVFRAGFARTIPAARQLVGHGHVRVDGHKVDRPGFRVRAGQVISLRDRSKSHPGVLAALEGSAKLDASWLSVDLEARRATVTELPDHTSVPFPVQVQLVVEFYSQRV